MSSKPRVISGIVMWFPEALPALTYAAKIIRSRYEKACEDLVAVQEERPIFTVEVMDELNAWLLADVMDEVAPEALVYYKWPVSYPNTLRRLNKTSRGIYDPYNRTTMPRVGNRWPLQLILDADMYLQHYCRKAGIGSEGSPI